MLRCCGIVLFCGILMFLGCDSSLPAGAGIGQKAIEIEGKGVDGRTVRLGDYKGKVVLIDFWASWCIPCRMLIPHEQELVNTYKGRPFAILGISRDHTFEDLKEFLATQKLPWANIYDSSGDITRAWAVEVLPSFVLVDDQGIVRGRWLGTAETADADSLIPQLIRKAEQR
jgi:thiol-disulfide isomerase/thioredoxin